MQQLRARAKSMSLLNPSYHFHQTLRHHFHLHSAHRKNRKHNSHVAAIVARLRADSGCALDADQGVKLARAWCVKHPHSDPAENAPGVADLGVEAAVLDQEAAIVEISLEQAVREVAGALDGGNGGFGLEEIDGVVGAEGVEDESDGEEYDENSMME